MATYIYSIYDANPNEVIGTVWPHHDREEIEADSDTEAIEEVESILSSEASGLRPEDGYEVGQRLYAHVWESGTIIGYPTYDLTAEDLGVEGKDHVAKWETVASYVATFPNGDDDGACDVSVQIGQGLDGQWYMRTEDDAGGDDSCDATGYDSRDEAVEAAEAFAEENNEAEDGEDAEDYLARQLEERAGEPDTEGDYCVYFDTSLDDSGPGERYASAEAAEAAAQLANNALRAANPGGNLLCAYEVRELVDGEWARIDR